MSILADVAPYSREYHTLRQRVGSQAQNNTELEIEYEKILNRVKKTRESVIKMNDQASPSCRTQNPSRARQSKAHSSKRRMLLLCSLTPRAAKTNSNRLCVSLNPRSLARTAEVRQPLFTPSSAWVSSCSQWEYRVGVHVVAGISASQARNTESANA